jgi:LysR family glycine cleavage system transcriptional activator
VEAAASGWGVAMAREDFIVGDLEAGRLVVPFAARLPSSRAWFLISFSDPPPHVAAFRAWLLGQARSSRAAVKPRRAARRARRRA